MIVSCFAGSGKSTLAENNNLYIDLESSDFQWIYPKNLVLNKEQKKGIKDKIKNENFIKEYVDSIQKHHNLSKIVLIACQPPVLKGLRERKLPYFIVTPTKDCKNEYLTRYIERNNNKLFITSMEENFEKYVNDLISDNYSVHTFLLNSSQYLSDISLEIEQHKKD